MRSSIWIVAALFSMTALVAVPGAPAQVEQVPCGDPRGCPDLIVDQTRFVVGTQRTENFGANSCAVQEGMITAGQRQVIRFTFNSPNIGKGDLKIGSPADHPEWFEFATCHNHFHFREYADYRLWTPAQHQSYEAIRQAEPGKTAAQVLAEHPELAPVAGMKMGFCVIDIMPGVGVNQAAPDPLPKYTNCNNDQGISRGWADEYLFTLDGQWIDVTGLATGAYVLEAEINAERLYVEESYTNNRAWLPVGVLSNL